MMQCDRYFLDLISATTDLSLYNMRYLDDMVVLHKINYSKWRQFLHR